MEQTQRGPERLSGGQTFHSPRGSWCREPLWFCKLWVEGGGEKQRGVSKAIHPQSPARQVRGNSELLQPRGRGGWGRGRTLTQQ